MNLSHGKHIPMTRRGGSLVGLQRKLSAAIVLTLVLTLSGIEYFSFHRNMHRHRQAVSAEMARYEVILQRLFIGADQEMVQAVRRMAAAEAEPHMLALAGSLLSTEVDAVHIYSSERELLASESNARAAARHSSPEAAAAVTLASREGRPVRFLECSGPCVQRIFVPLELPDGARVVVNINRNADVLVENFYQLTGADLAIFDIGPEGTPGETVPVLSRDGTKNLSVALPLLHKARQRAASDGSFHGRLDQGFFSARYFTLEGVAQPGLHVLMFKPQPATAQLIWTAVQEVALTLALILLFSLAALTLTLRAPLQKVLKLADLLRLLPHGDFTSAKLGLSEIPPRSQRRDEADVLRDSLGEVIGDLEQLHTKNIAQREKLKQKILELTEATRFNNMLLDVSPLIVIIHDGDGLIHNINALGRKLVDTDAGNGKPANINQWVRGDFQQRSLSEALAVLMKDEDRTIQGEMPLFDRKGMRIEVLWMHRAIRVKGQPRILSMGMDVTEQHEAMRSLQWLGRHDRVTGLLNRLSFIDDAKNLSDNIAPDNKLDLILINVDDFAKFNDRFDFTMGDKLLLELARYVSLTLPEGALLARSGSDEFMALVEHSADETADYRSALEALTRYDMETPLGTEVIHLSVVVNQVPADRSMGIDELISDTTALLTRVKSKARGQVFLATEDHIDRLSRQEKYHMKDLLQKALDENRLLLFYQPIINLREKRLSHCECLVRMLDEEGQFVPPSKFLGVAAELGLMSQIDYAVIEMAMEQQRRWQDKDLDIGLSINLTAHTMELPDFEQRLNELLLDTGADPGQLIFEVVETDALESISAANLLLRNFRTIGAKIALDDFGVGFTSFEYIRELPVDYIKIDQSFVRFIDERPNDQALVRSMIEMSHSLNKQVIVEGVETKAALDMVREMGAEYVQGYYISRPMPLDALNLAMPLKDML